MPRDKIGQEIKVGSFVAYGHALGRCAGIRIGIVRSIKNNDVDEYGNKVHPEKHFKIRVRGIEDDWSYSDPHEFSRRKLCSRDGTLEFINRIIVLLDEQVPEEYRKLLLALDNL